MTVKPLTIFLFGVLPIFTITLIAYFVKLTTHQPYFTSLLYQLTSNNIALFYIISLLVLLLWLGCYILHRISVGQLDSDEREDIAHYINYIIADVINLLFMRSYLDLSSGSIILLSTCIRCLTVIAKVRIANLGRYLTFFPYFRLTILLNTLFWFSISLLLYHFRLIVNVTSPKSLFAYELVTCTLTIIELMGKFVFDSITIFFNNSLAPLDPDLLYPTPAQLKQRADTLRRTIELNFAEEDENEVLLHSPTQTNIPNQATEDDENPEIQQQQQQQFIEPPLSRAEKIQNALDEQLRAEENDRQRNRLTLPIWYRYFGRNRVIYNACAWVSRNHTFVDTVIELASSFLKLAIYTHILIRYYKIILPIYTLRRTIGAIAKTVGGIIKLRQIFMVKTNMGEMFHRLSIYESAFLSEQEVCGVCLVDFSDEALDGKSMIDACKIKNFHDFLQEKRLHVAAAAKKANPSSPSDSNSNAIGEGGEDENDANMVQINPRDYDQMYLTKKNVAQARLMTYKQDQSAIGYLSCCHYFHHECIGEWLRRDSRCPVCRKTSHGNFKHQAVHQIRQAEHEKVLNKAEKKDMATYKAILASKPGTLFGPTVAKAKDGDKGQDSMNLSAGEFNTTVNPESTQLNQSFSTTSIRSNGSMHDDDTLGRKSTQLPLPPFKSPQPTPSFHHFASIYSPQPLSNVQPTFQKLQSSSLSNLSSIDTSDPHSSTTTSTIATDPTNFNPTPQGNVLGNATIPLEQTSLCPQTTPRPALIPPSQQDPPASTSTPPTPPSINSLSLATTPSLSQPQPSLTATPSLLLSPSIQDLKKMERQERLKAQQLLREQTLNARSSSISTPSKSFAPSTSSSDQNQQPNVLTEKKKLDLDHLPLSTTRNSQVALIVPTDPQPNLIKPALNGSNSVAGQKEGSEELEAILDLLASDYYQDPDPPSHQDPIEASGQIPQSFTTQIQPVMRSTPPTQIAPPPQPRELTPAQQKQVQMFAQQIQSIQSQICTLFQRKEQIRQDSNETLTDIDTHLASLHALLHQSIELQQLCLGRDTSQ